MRDQKIKVLHLGNVANYAYNIAKILQTDQVESHAINWDYYHINSRPEWEDGDFDSEEIGDQFFPVFPSESENGFSAPQWYIHGPMRLACLYLIAYNEKKYLRARLIRALNNRYLRRIADPSFRTSPRAQNKSRVIEALCSDLVGVGRGNTWRAFRSWRANRRAATQVISVAPPAIVPVEPAEPPVRQKASAAQLKRERNRAKSEGDTAAGDGELRPVRAAALKQKNSDLRKSEGIEEIDSASLADTDAKEAHGEAGIIQEPHALSTPVTVDEPEHEADRPIFFATVLEIDARAKSKASAVDRQTFFRPDLRFGQHAWKWIDDYSNVYPGRAFDPMLLKQYEHLLPLMERLVKSYDLVVGYALEGIWPMVVQKKYLAYEFGTIRNIPFTDNPQGRLGFLTYRNALKTVVTNCDTQGAAEKLQLDYFFLPHVINEDGKPSEEETALFRKFLQDQYGGDFFVFHPPRQHWNAKRDTNWDKGNDHFFRGFADFVKTTAPNARCIAVDWGEHVQDSRRLIRALGISANVIWITPQPHVSMMRYINASDVVADQFSLKTFGGIPPKAFYLGKPVISAFDPAIHAWCFAEMPPIPPANKASEISSALVKLYSDRDYAAEIGQKGKDWYQKYNSSARIREIFAKEIVAVTRAQKSKSWSEFKKKNKARG